MANAVYVDGSAIIPQTATVSPVAWAYGEGVLGPLPSAIAIDTPLNAATGSYTATGVAATFVISGGVINPLFMVSPTLMHFNFGTRF